MAGLHRWPVPFLLILSLAARVLGDFIVDDFTKPARTCEPFLLQWQGGITPWTLRILDAQTLNVIDDFGSTKETAFTWTVDVSAGHSVLVQVQDATGKTAESKPLAVQAGSAGCRASKTSTRSTVASTTSKPTTTTKAAESTKTITFQPSWSFIVEQPAASTNTPTNSSSRSSNSTTAPFQSSQEREPDASASAAAVPVIGAASVAAPNVGLILGLLVPGVALLVFMVVFISRRRRERRDVEHVGDPQMSPVWYARPGYGFASAPTATTSDALSYSTFQAQAQATSQSSTSISRADIPSSRYRDSLSTHVSTLSSASGDLGARVQRGVGELERQTQLSAFRFPSAGY
ncbi:hypothetical protein MIND_01189200 [Mycena indigotica]|uniref:Mid2 domain-containing protein n=1 Tax=Mycena indigotica TaxID=2126181 RepID=A0A8H6S6C6_9AGAR|nr:uncharacterized protein MIND_01189200 [Mycena indigotica]KAF7292901.1 hypothetical protein MIND_01189200 [Mycena indigotica]